MDKGKWAEELGKGKGKGEWERYWEWKWKGHAEWGMEKGMET